MARARLGSRWVGGLVAAVAVLLIVGCAGVTGTGVSLGRVATTTTAAASHDYGYLAAFPHGAYRNSLRLAASPARDCAPVRVVTRVGVAAEEVSSIDPALVRFSQDSVKGTFRNGGSVEDLASGLRNGAIKPSDVPPIRVVERDGELFTLDNRRLEAFRRAGVPIRYRYATPEEAANDAFKFTTRNGGQSVRVRGG